MKQKDGKSKTAEMPFFLIIKIKKMNKIKPNYKKRMEKYFEDFPFSQEYELKKDEINGKTYAVGKINKDGILVPITNFYTPKEMSAYLFGLYDSQTGKY